MFQLFGEQDGKIVKFQENTKVKIEKEEVKETIQFKEVYGVTRLSQTSYLILVTNSQKVGNIKSHDIFKVKQVILIPLPSDNKLP